MPIRVRCQCGQQFAAKVELAGKRLTCPTCKQPLLIPMPAQVVQPRAPARPVVAANPAALRPVVVPAGASVAVKCRCGQAFKAASHLFGKTLNCPTCKSPLKIPFPAMLQPQPVAPNPVDPLGDPLGNPLGDPLAGGFGGFGSAPADNDPFGVGIMNSAAVLPQTPLPQYANYSAPAVAKPTAPKKKKGSKKNAKLWTGIGSGLGAAAVVALLVLGFVGRMVRIARQHGLIDLNFSSVNVEWVPHSSPDGYSVEIVKHAQGVVVPGLPMNMGQGGVIAASSKQGPCTIVACERLPIALSDAQAALALSSWESMVSSSIQGKSGKIISISGCSLGGIPGKQVMVEIREGLTTTVTQFQAAFKNDRAYVLGFLATKAVYKQEDANRFFNSFRLTGNQAT